MTNTALAAIVLLCFAAGFIACWLAMREALRLRNLARLSPMDAFFSPECKTMEESPPGGTAFPNAARIEGCLNIPKGVSRDAYMKELARILLNPLPAMGGISPVVPEFEIQDRTPDSLVFSLANPTRLGLPFAYKEGRVALLPPKDPTSCSFRIYYEMNVSEAIERWTRWIMLFVVALELPVVIALPFGLGYFCMGSSNPAIRLQIFQVIQIVHVLWPPFLFLHLVKRSLRNSAIVFEAFLKSAAAEAQRANERQSDGWQADERHADERAAGERQRGERQDSSI